MFILECNSGRWCYQHLPTYFNAVGEADTIGTMYQFDSSVFGEISIFSISFSVIVGVLLGCLLTLMWKKHKYQAPKTIHSSSHKIPARTNQILASRMIHSAVKDLISSQYVVKDREHFESLLQTPLRSSLEQLRIVADSLTANSETTAPISAWSSKNKHHSFYRGERKTLHCDVLNTITEQLAFMHSQQSHASLLHRNTVSYSPILPVCPLWFGRAIRELLVNSVKHNQHARKLEVEVSTSLADGYFIVCISDNGLGLSSEITHKLNTLRVKKEVESSASLFANQEAINLASMKTILHQLQGSLEVLSAKKLLTKVILKIPLVEQTQALHADHQECAIAADELNLKPNVSKLLLISQQNEIQFGSMQLLNERFNLYRATSVAEGLRLMLLQKPDCVLFDTGIEVSNVVDTLRGLEESTELAGVPIVILENHQTEKQRSSARQSGISAFIAKPADARHIAFTIEKVIHEKQKLDEQVSEGIANYHLSLVAASNVNDQADLKFLERFTKVLQENHINEGFKLPEAAKLMLLTEKTLVRRLNQHYQLGFTKKLRQFRLHVAKDLLTKGAKVTNAAYDSGFSSPSYFAKCFRDEFGFAPSMLVNSQSKKIETLLGANKP